jgi:IS30 family transposase
MPAKVKVDRDRLAALTADGWTVDQLAEHFSVHPSTISRLRTQLGISQKPVMTDDRKQTIAGMIADGWSRAEISRTEGADRETIERYFPGSAWTEKQRAAHLSTLRMENPYFNKHPGRRIAA